MDGGEHWKLRVDVSGQVQNRCDYESTDVERMLQSQNRKVQEMVGVGVFFWNG